MKKYSEVKTEIIADFYLEVICDKFNVKKTDIKRKGRNREAADIRAMVCFLTKLKFRKAKLHEIGNYFKQKHSTVKYSINKIYDLINLDAVISTTIAYCLDLDFEVEILRCNKFSKCEETGVLIFKTPKTISTFSLYSHSLVFAEKDANGNFVKKYKLNEVDVFDAIIMSKSEDPLSEIINLLKK